MSDKPTFHMGQDWVALLELGPAARVVLDLLHCNALFGRSGIVTHTVHVTSAWFTEMTSHWEKPVKGPTARRGMNELIQKGVLIRLNEPQDGSGFVVSFVRDPGPDHTGPVNGFEHAKRVSSKNGTKALYERRDAKGSLPFVWQPSSFQDDAVGDLAKDLRDSLPDAGTPEPAEKDLPDSDPPEPESGPEYSGYQDTKRDSEWDNGDPGDDVEFDMSVFDRPSENTSAGWTATPSMAEFSTKLQLATAQKPEEKLHLMAGECQRIAKAAKPLLEQGWDPGMLASRMAAYLNDKINTPERFLLSKVKDIGTPPAGSRGDGSVGLGGDVVDPSAVDMGFSYGSGPSQKKYVPTPKPVTEEERKNRLVDIARKFGQK